MSAVPSVWALSPRAEAVAQRALPRKVQLNQPPHYGKVSARNVVSTDQSQMARAIKDATMAIRGAQLTAQERRWRGVAN